jgi:hypothetical protein
LRTGATVLSLILALAAVRASWVRNHGSDAIDFYLFWLVGQAADRVPDPWSDEGRRALGAIGARAQLDPEASPGLRAAARHTSLETTATPALYAAFRALSTGDYELDYALFHLLSLACACAAVLILGATFHWPLWASLLASAAFLALSAPLATDAWVGNVNQIQLAGLAALIALARAPPRALTSAAAGVLAALLALFKPNLAPVALLLLAVLIARRAWKPAALFAGAGALAALATVVASSAAFSSGAWPSWAHAASALARDTTLTTGAGNLSFSHALGAPAWLANAAAVALIAIALVLALRAGNAREAEVGAAGAGVAIPLLCATLAWQHYFVLLTPSVLYLSRPARTAAFAAGALALVLLWFAPYGLHSARAVAVAAGIATLAVLAASLWLLRPAASRS